MDGPTRPERRLWRPDVRQDVEDELAFHLEMRERDYRERGASEAEAHEAAARRFGDRRAVAATCRAIDEQWHRDRRRRAFLADLRQDLAYAARTLRKAPGFTAVAMITLALGIGANAAIFSVINSVLLRPLPYANADRLAFIWSTGPTGAPEPVSPARFLDLQRRLTSVDRMAAICQFSVTLTGADDPEQVDAASVSSSFFDVLGAPPLLGAPFRTGAADPHAVVLSHGLWVRRFGSDSGIIGREVALNGRNRRVVAVMRPDFAWPAITTQPSNIGGPELWIPGAMHDLPRTPADDPSEDLSTNRQLGILRVVGRIADQATLATASRQAAHVGVQLASEYPRTDSARGFTAVSLRTQFFGPVAQPLYVLLGAVGFVLAIACANVASLLLGRATTRRREMAVRLALGASRARIVRQLLTESVALASIGGAMGLLVAWWAERALVGLSPGGILRIDQTRIDWVVLAFTIGVSIVSGIAFGLVPAWQVSRAQPGTGLRDSGGRGAAGSGGRARDLLVAAEIAVALVLVVGAALMLRSFTTLSAVDTGLDLRHLLTFHLAAPDRGRATPEQQTAFYDHVLERLRSLPGVLEAGAAVTLPIGGDTFSTTYIVEGQPLPDRGREPSAGYQIVSTGYFRAAGMRVLQGRDFQPSDRHGAPPVVAVNETLAQQAWPGQQALGRQVRFGRDTDDPPATVIAVVSDIRHGGPGARPRPELYQPLAQRAFSSMAFVVRTAGDPLSYVPAVRAEIRAIAPAIPVAKVATMEQHVARAVSRPRFLSTLIGAFGALALALAVVGIYGVMACSVSERAQEIAIRMALGARPGDVIGMVLSKAAVLSSAGVGIGIVAALGLSRVVAGLLFGVSPTDAATFSACAVVLLLVALLAAAVPARQASRVEGAGALRS